MQVTGVLFIQVPQYPDDWQLSEAQYSVLSFFKNKQKIRELDRAEITLALALIILIYRPRTPLLNFFILPFPMLLPHHDDEMEL